MIAAYTYNIFLSLGSLSLVASPPSFLFSPLAILAYPVYIVYPRVRTSFLSRSLASPGIRAAIISLIAFPSVTEDSFEDTARFFFSCARSLLYMQNLSVGSARGAAITHAGTAETRGSLRYAYIQPEELHASRLWVTKYGRGNEGKRENKKENNSAKEPRWENEADRETGRACEGKSERGYKTRVKGRQDDAGTEGENRDGRTGGNGG